MGLYKMVDTAEEAFEIVKTARRELSLITDQAIQQIFSRLYLKGRKCYRNIQ